MRTKLALAAVAVAALVLPAAAAAQEGHGKGHGGGHGNGGGHGRGHAEQGQDHGRGNDRQHGPERRAERQDERRGPDRVVVRDLPRPDRDVRIVTRDPRRDDRRGDRRDDRPDVVVIRDVPRTVIVGCPPGLAKKDNGCLPPGQARQIARADRTWDDWYWSQMRDDGRWRYDDGYVYRMTDNGGVAGWLPVLGGALGLGNVWPQQYTYQPVPQYYTGYYGLNQPYDYRYADGVVYGVDPQSQAINSVVALLTGQQINVGQRLPAGYDVYNVPYAYRNQYAVGPNAYYRYNDGYVYQVDPTTQLVQAVIQLLT